MSFKKISLRVVALVITSLVFTLILWSIVYGPLWRDHLRPQIIADYDLGPILIYIENSGVDQEKLYQVLRPHKSIWDMLFGNFISTVAIIGVYSIIVKLAKRLFFKETKQTKDIQDTN